MKGLFLTLVILMSSASAGELVFDFKNPSFSGRGYSNHVLSTEQLRYNREQEIAKKQEAEQRRIERELENTILNKFVQNLESRIYATLSKQMVDNMFVECEDDTSCTEPDGGSTEIEGATITWNRDDTGAITLTVDGPDGFTEIEIPGPGELLF